MGTSHGNWSGEQHSSYLKRGQLSGQLADVCIPFCIQALCVHSQMLFGDTNGNVVALQSD